MLKQDLVYKQKDCLGLDIGASSIKIVQLKKKKNLTKLVGYGSEKLPENVVIEGIISDPGKIAELIKKMMNEVTEGKFTAEKVIASIPDTNVFIRVLELPDLSGKDLKEAVMFEADQSIPMSTTDLIVDYQVLGPSSTKSDMNDVLLVAAPRAIVNSYIQLFQFLRLKPEAIEMSLSSVLRALVSNKEKNEVIMIADMGAKSTNFGVYDNALRFSDSIDFGGDAFTESIIKSLGLEKRKAEEEKIGIGLHDKKILDAIKGNLDSLQTEIKKVIRYHDERTSEDRKITKLILCGGSANIPGLTEYLAEKSGLEVKVGNPWVNIDTYPLKQVPKKEAPAFANAIGLSLRGIMEVIK